MQFVMQMTFYGEYKEHSEHTGWVCDGEQVLFRKFLPFNPSLQDNIKEIKENQTTQSEKSRELWFLD